MKLGEIALEAVDTDYELAFERFNTSAMDLEDHLGWSAVQFNGARVPK
jgi:hypothetical protein